ncbi:hypothetical protein BJ508DRAFT_325397 [Ascobolus immersus RN42]|uniref:DUF7918 domain-containing protein n=1 Tax=Ascobolus immersus RN42 TaxID=1160509 RepID=A0A3N4I9B1_ASCIM|nr:hypothetical protein BJ508DRAFT_325397 [Ascobolus immersus RN42]
MVSSNNIQFTILDSTGTPLPEYDNPFPSEEDVKNGVASCYVETPPATSPQTFTIKINTIKPLNYNETLGYYFDAFFDGVKSAHGTTIGEFRSARKGNDKEVVIDSFHEVDNRGAKITDKELVFKPMDMANDGGSLAAMRRAENAGFNPQDIGSIKLKFAEVIERPRCGVARYQSAHLGAVGGKVNEKALKGNSSSHSIGGGKTLAIKDASKASLLKCSPKWYEVKIFYRSRESLQNIGLVKRDPKPEVKSDPAGRKGKPKPEVITIDDSDDEAPAPASRLVKPERGVKREREGTVAVKSEKRVKKEASVPKVVDMTADD